MRVRFFVVVAVLAACLLGAASPARASEQFGDLDVSFLSLKVNDRGEALVTYRTAKGAVRHVYVWGAINANAPSQSTPAGAFQLRLLRRPEAERASDLADVRRSLRALRRAAARVARDRLQGARRLLLGAAALAAHAADARHRAVPARAGGVRAPHLPLVGPAPGARGVAELDVRRPLAGALRQAHLPRAARLRVPHAVVDAARLLRALLLRRHVQLGVRPRLEARRRQGRAQPQRRLLLQLRAADDAGRLPGRTCCGRPGTASATGSP